jgi:NAD(P)-dependent dehydrogenase (short-subunit alcohol dehydrogenase family)
MSDNMTAGPMAGKTVLVTGGTGGIGRATAAGLAALGARVAITGRDLARSRAAAADIAATTGNPAVDAFAADLSSQAEVRRLAREVLGAYPRLDVLVNNVGGFWSTRRVTPDGLEQRAPWIQTLDVKDAAWCGSDTQEVGGANFGPGGQPHPGAARPRAAWPSRCRTSTSPRVLDARQGPQCGHDAAAPAVSTGGQLVMVAVTRRLTAVARPVPAGQQV